MGALINEVLKRNKKIKLLNELDLTADVQPDRLFHLYFGERQGCEFEFSVSQAMEDQDSICCPRCLTDNFVRDRGDAVLMRGEIDNEF